MKRWIGVIVLLMGCVLYAEAQQQAVPLKVDVSSTFQGILRPGAAGEVTLTLTNQLPVRQMSLKATATYEHGGQVSIVHSNELVLQIDDSITVRQLTLMLNNLTNIQIRDAAGRSVAFAINGGEVLLSNIVVGQSQPTVLKVTGNVAVSTSSP